MPPRMPVQIKKSGSSAMGRSGGEQEIQQIVRNHLGTSQSNLRRHMQKPVFAEERYPVVPAHVIYPQPQLATQNSSSARYLQP